MNADESRIDPTGDRPRPDEPSTNGRSAASSSPLSVLIVEDDDGVARAAAIALEVAGHRSDRARDAEEAYSALAATSFDAILLDLNFAAGRTDGADGLACLERIVAGDPNACVVALTAHSGIRIAVAAMRAGARDFVMKPWRNADLVAKLTAAVARASPAPAAVAAPVPDGAHGLARLIGDSPAMAALRALVRRIGATRAGVTIRGPAGAGRSLVALALHELGGDASPPIVVDLRDADAWAAIERTEAGTLILEHPDRLDEVAQARLLARIGDAARPIAIVATDGTIGPALARRVATAEIAVPPLAARPGDAMLLARHFARGAARRFGRVEPAFTPAASALVADTVWPDEVRGLALAVERAVLLAEDGRIDAAALMPPAAPVAATPARAFRLVDREKAAIEAALAAHHFNVTHAAAALGLSRGALYRRMTRFGL